MSKQYDAIIPADSVERHDISVSIGKIQEDTQVTVKGTGWTEEEKGQMEKAGYDGVDKVNAWYS